MTKHPHSDAAPAPAAERDTDMSMNYGNFVTDPPAAEPPQDVAGLIAKMLRFAELERKMADITVPDVTKAEGEEWMDLDQSAPQREAEAAAALAAMARERDNWRLIAGTGFHSEHKALGDVLRMEQRAIKAERERDDTVRRMEQGWVQVCAEPAIKHYKDAAEQAERALAEWRKAALAWWFAEEQDTEDDVAFFNAMSKADPEFARMANDAARGKGDE